MRLIKLEIQTPRKSRGIKIHKHAVALDSKAVKYLRDFIEYVKRVCGLKGAYTMSVDGFNMADEDTVKILQQNTVYRMNIAKRKTRIVESPSQSSSQDVVSSESSDSSQQSSSEEIQRISRSKKIEKSVSKKSNLKQQKLSKVEQKEEKQKRKGIVKKVSSDSDQSSSSQSSSVQALNPSSKTTPKVVPPKKGSLKQNRNQIKDNNKLLTAQNTTAVLTFAQKADLSRTLNKKFNKAVIQQNSDSQSSSTPVKVPTQPTKVLKKAMVRNQVSQSSDSSESQEVKPKVKPVSTVSKPAQPVKKLPPALRNKANKSFQQHKENQWIVLDKQKCKKWEEKGKQTICQVLNKVRFKVIQFDQERFVPVKSNWILGEVNSVQGKEVKLINVEEEGKGFKKQYKIPEVNMDELQLWKPLATPQQIECFSQNIPEQKLIQKQHQVPEKEQKPTEDRNSVEKMVCGQLNYYFSDKNYNTDFFMQMHANNHPQKYMRLSFMLNFPKIKKVLRDEDKLWLYLKEDEKYETRNYEIDFDQKLIRKKHILDPRQVHRVERVPQLDKPQQNHKEEVQENVNKKDE